MFFTCIGITCQLRVVVRRRFSCFSLLTDSLTCRALVLFANLTAWQAETGLRRHRDHKMSVFFHDSAESTNSRWIVVVSYQRLVYSCGFGRDTFTHRPVRSLKACTFRLIVLAILIGICAPLSIDSAGRRAAHVWLTVIAQLWICMIYWPTRKQRTVSVAMELPVIHAWFTSAHNEIYAL